VVDLVKPVSDKGSSATISKFFSAEISTHSPLRHPAILVAAAVAEAFGIRGSLELPASRALGFYAIIGAATLGGAALAMTDIDPIAMLFWTAVLNSIVSVPIMAAMMLAVSGKSHPASYAAALAAISRLAGDGSHGRRSRGLRLDLDVTSALKNAREHRPLHR
jgi:hypothetical protein